MNGTRCISGWRQLLKPETSQRHGCAHELQKTPARNLIAVQFRRARGKFALEPAAKFRRVASSPRLRQYCLPGQVSVLGVGKCVSSMTPLTICRRLDVPALFQREADFLLGEVVFLRPIVGYSLRFPYFATNAAGFTSSGFQSRLVI